MATCAFTGISVGLGQRPWCDEGLFLTREPEEPGGGHPFQGPQGGWSVTAQVERHGGGSGETRDLAEGSGSDPSL